MSSTDGAFDRMPDERLLVLTIAARLKRTGMEKKLLIGGSDLKL